MLLRVGFWRLRLRLLECIWVGLMSVIACSVPPLNVIYLFSILFLSIQRHQNKITLANYYCCTNTFEKRCVCLCASCVWASYILEGVSVSVFVLHLLSIITFLLIMQMRRQGGMMARYLFSLFVIFFKQNLGSSLFVLFYSIV